MSRSTTACQPSDSRSLADVWTDSADCRTQTSARAGLDSAGVTSKIRIYAFNALLRDGVTSCASVGAGFEGPVRGGNQVKGIEKAERQYSGQRTRGKPRMATVMSKRNAAQKGPGRGARLGQLAE